MHNVIVGIDEARMYDAPSGINRLSCIKALCQLRIAANLHDARAGDCHRAPPIDSALRIHRDDLAVVYEKIADALVHCAPLRIRRYRKGQFPFVLSLSWTCRKIVEGMG